VLNTIYQIYHTRRKIVRIDFEKVKEKFRETGRAPTLWARAKGLNESAFRNYMAGRSTPSPNGIAEQRLIRLLAEDGLLALVDEPAKANRAA
jgi:hypothetical protein